MVRDDFKTLLDPSGMDFRSCMESTLSFDEHIRLVGLASQGERIGCLSLGNLCCTIDRQRSVVVALFWATDDRSRFGRPPVTCLNGLDHPGPVLQDRPQSRRAPDSISALDMLCRGTQLSDLEIELSLRSSYSVGMLFVCRDSEEVYLE